LSLAAARVSRFHPAMNTSDSEIITVAETGKGRYQVEARVGGSTLLIDEPVEVGGMGSGPNPYNLLAAALGACTTMTIRLYAQRKGWPLAHVQTAVRHTRASVAARDSFALEIRLEGTLTPEQRKRLLEIAEKCPVHLTMARGSDVSATLLPPAETVPPPVSGPAHVNCMVEACDNTG
jgi:putative redox protein